MFPRLRTVFLSSVAGGLAEYRDTAAEAIGYLDDWKCVRMEDSELGMKFRPNHVEPPLNGALSSLVSWGHSMEVHFLIVRGPIPKRSMTSPALSA